ncbi:UTP--glucose-1-phosphate uridylyltransferase [Pirellula sp. SH-Sr6A]|uniref:sugar phosphate nucleotidyltransferase n=1 Tax=Pirellula sp. SH-Sr6A TaxID=1632865 RepID=UPI00078D0493|nr:sugar phosphate nucleotidyltransferase [Pirellula sp. SH-Sr6A]AMV34395.1 UTP--glucose-1-phosphate uridylyltransferase [Pirellula sp. SH-Sr6A]
MRIQKAVITAAGPGQGALPLQRLVDRDGMEKTALEMIVEEIDAAGIESIGIVISPGNEEAYRKAAGPYLDRLTFVIQPEPRGYGQALLCAKTFARNEPFLHLVGDHLYLSRNGQRCAQQIIEVATKENSAVSGVHPTKEKMLPYFGAIGGNRLPQTDRLYEVKRVIEKPTPTLAEQELTIAGFRSGIYLCFFGMHVLTPSVLDILESLVDEHRRPIALSEALQELALRERYLAVEVEGFRYNIGVKYGLLNTQLALSLSGVDRDQVLSDMVELLATR